MLGLWIGTNSRQGLDGRIIQSLHNGLTPPDSLTTGPLWVRDYLDTLVSAGADRVAVPGMRLATTVAEGADSEQKIINGTFDTDTTGWTGNNATLGSVAGELVVTLTGAFGKARQSFESVPGRTYLVVGVSKVGTLSPVFRVGSTLDGLDLVNAMGAQIIDTSFVATTTTTYVSLWVNSSNGGDTAIFDDISIIEVIPKWLPTDTEGTAFYPSQQVRTRQGTVTQYTGDYKGMMVMPARTNLFTAPGAPVTQGITTTVQQYAVSVYGTGSVTLSGSAVGTVNAGEELVVTAEAGTLTVTVTGTPDHVQVEAGSFATPPIGYGETAAITHTRAATVAQWNSANFLRTQGLALWGRFYPGAAGQTAHLLGCKTDADNLLEVTLTATTVKLNKIVAAAAAGPSVSYTHTKDTGMEYRALLTEQGMSLQVKQDEGAWSAWVDDTSDDAKAAAVIASTFQIGADGDGAGQVGGTFPFTASAFTPSFADLAAGKTWVETNTQWNVLGVSA